MNTQNYDNNNLPHRVFPISPQQQQQSDTNVQQFLNVNPQQKQFHIANGNIHQQQYSPNANVVAQPPLQQQQQPMIPPPAPATQQQQYYPTDSSQQQGGYYLPPPPPPPQQSQQENLIQITKRLIQSLGKNPNELSFINKNITEALEKINDKCLFNHSILNIPDDQTNTLLMQIKNTYRDYNNRPLEEKNDRVFKDFCPACIFCKFGLFSDDITTALKSFTCTNVNNYSSEFSGYRLGHFVHVCNPYISENPLKGYDTTYHPSEKTAFHSGTLLIPTGKILIQLLALPQELLSDGFKIVQIMSDECDIDDIRYYLRFFNRNKKLNTGYYRRKRDMTADKLKQMNQNTSNSPPSGGSSSSSTTPIVCIGDDEDDEKYIEKIKNLYNNIAKDFPAIKAPPLANNSNIGVATDSDDNFNYDNVFQNGERLEYVALADSANKEDIKMKIFDLNPVFIMYLQSMINIQNHLENNTNTSNANNMYYTNQDDDEQTRKIKNDYISLWKPTAPIISSVFFDLLMMGFYNELDIDELLHIPPLNNKCLFTQQNILVVNKDGKCIMSMNKDNSSDARCTIFNTILKQSSIPLQQKTVSTGFPHNINSKGVPPPSLFSSNVINALDNNNYTATAAAANKDNTFNVIYNFHKNQSQNHHNNLKNNKERLANFFCQLKDDMDDTVDPDADKNCTIIDLAMRMLPQKIIQSTHNKSMYSIHYSNKATSKPVVKEEPNPNCVYVKNLGFVSLRNLCNKESLTLMNSTVYLENLVHRDQEGYVNKTSDNCGYNEKSNENEDTTRTFSHITINALPQKRKIDPNNVIDLVSKKSTGFDYSGYIKKMNCNNPYTFADYSHKYAANDSNCQRKV